MKTLLFHCKRYEVEIKELANRPKTILPEKIEERKQKIRSCIAVFLTVEKNDKIAVSTKELALEITKMAKDVGSKNIVLMPFAHLSNKIATSEESKKAIEMIVLKLEKNFNVIKSHFGSHKSLLLDVYGHPGNVRYREF